MECIAVDWSGAVTGAASRIWIARASAGVLTSLVAPGSRAAVREVLVARRLHAAPCVVGLDFAFSLPAWFIDAARRGAERVGPAGGPATGAVFAALYGWSCWQDGGLTPMPARIAPLGRAMAEIFA